MSISRHEPTFDLGGPILKNRAWFYVGTAPEIDRTERTVTFRTNGRRPTFEQNENDYNTIWQRDGAAQRQACGCKATVNLQSMKRRAGTHRQRRRLPDDRAGRHEHLEPDALPEPDLSSTRSTTSTSARSTGW